MNVYFLGTGTSQGIPVIGSNHPVCLSEDARDQRLRVSVWIEWEGFSLVIDCGPDFRQQMLVSKCPRLDALLFTHEHADHTAGLDDIRPFYFYQGKISIYAHKRVMNNLANRFDYIFKDENKYPGAPSVNQHIVSEDVAFELGGKTIIPVSVNHGGLQVFGYRIDDFAYITDMKTIDEAEVEKLSNLDVLVINTLRNEPHEMHLNLEEALEFIKKIKPKKTYLTHISHLFGFHKDIEATLPENVFVAYDNLQITL